MVGSIVVSRSRHLRKLAVAGAGVALLTALTVGQAAAFHCYVADKPDDAGNKTTFEVTTETLDGAQVAGNSGNIVLRGAFADVTVGGTTVAEDVFIRGQPVDEGVQGLGTLPSEPHDNGSDEHGVLSLEEPG